MGARIQKKDVVNRIAKRLATDEKSAETYLDATLETLYEAFKAGESVTLPGFGSFYVRAERDSWVFKFKPGQKLRALFGWSSTYRGEL
jgi:DNA-binding protein HU-beta